MHMTDEEWKAKAYEEPLTHMSSSQLGWQYFEMKQDHHKYKVMD